MCCRIHKASGTVYIEHAEFNTNKKGGNLALRGYLNLSPKNLSERCSRIFQRIEIAEKIAEIIDEIFHLIESIIEACTNTECYQILNNLHVGAHQFHDISHSLGIFNDIYLLLSGDFLKYKDKQKTQIDCWQSIIRGCHCISHSLAMASLCAIIFNMQKLNILKGRYNKLPSALGYGLSCALLIWKRYSRQVSQNKENALSTLIAQGSGFIFEILSVLEIKTFYLDKLTSLAGIIHAWTICQLLMPREKEKIKITLNVSQFINDKPSSQIHRSI